MLKKKEKRKKDINYYRIDKSIDQDLVEKAWQKGKIINGHEPNKYRQDECGAWIIKDQYGKRDSCYGWEIDIVDNSLMENGDNNLIRPVQWENKENKIGDKLIAIVKAVGPKNI